MQNMMFHEVVIARAFIAMTAVKHHCSHAAVNVVSTDLGRME